MEDNKIKIGQDASNMTEEERKKENKEKEIFFYKSYINNMCMFNYSYWNCIIILYGKLEEMPEKESEAELKADILRILQEEDHA